MMNRRMSVGALLSVCAFATVSSAEAPVAPAFVPNVIIANGDSLNGRFIEVFAGDMMIRSVTTQSETENSGVIQLREGAFDRVREAAEQIIAATPGANPRDIPCQDHGLDLIAVVMGPDTRTSVSANCPGNAVLVAQDALRALLQAEIVE